MMKNKGSKGFTLIELIVVMIIIGILVLLATPRFINYIKLARYTNIINDTRVVETVALPEMVKNNMDFPIGTGKVPVKVADLLKLVKEDKAYMKDGLLRTDLEKESKEFPVVGQISKWKIKETKGRISPNVVKEGESGLEGFYLLDKKKWVKPETRTRLPGEFLIDKEGNAIYVHSSDIGGGTETEKQTVKLESYVKYDDSNTFGEAAMDYGDHMVFGYESIIFPVSEMAENIDIEVGENGKAILNLKDLETETRLKKAENLGLRLKGFYREEGRLEGTYDEKITYDETTGEIELVDGIEFSDSIEIDLATTETIRLVYDQKFLSSVEFVLEPVLMPMGRSGLARDNGGVDIYGYTISEWKYIMGKNDKSYTLNVPEKVYTIDYSSSEPTLIKSNVESIGKLKEYYELKDMFQYSNLTSQSMKIDINFKNAINLKEIAGEAFNNLKLKEIDLSNNSKLNSIGDSVFNYGNGEVNQIDWVKFPNYEGQSIDIGCCAFDGHNIKNISFGDSGNELLLSIGEYAFGMAEFTESGLDLSNVKFKFETLEIGPGSSSTEPEIEYLIKENAFESFKDSEKLILSKDYEAYISGGTDTVFHKAFPDFTEIDFNNIRYK